MSNITALISDFDGTLCDTYRANVEAYRQAFEDSGLVFDQEAYARNFGLRFNEMMETIAPDSTPSIRQKVMDQKAIHYAANLDLITINTGLVTLLRSAKTEGKKIGLATTARRLNATAVLDHFSLIDLFDEMIFGEDVTNSKPNPECYNLIISRLEVNPEESLVFEDSHIGIEAAITAGAQVLKVAL